MTRPVLMLAAALFSLACSAPSHVVPDAGPDTSCGFDCDAQARFGLIVGRCFEYSDTASTATPPALGALVLPLFQLEGGVNVLPVEYRSGGSLKMRDSFLIVDGALKLARREFGIGGSVTYKSTAGHITGVTWLEAVSVSGSSASSTSTAQVNPGAGMDATTYAVVLQDATPQDLAVPMMTWPAGLKLLFNESPDHGTDSRRVWVDGTGFTLFASSFVASGGSTQEFRLQGIKDNVTGSCGL